jgi:integrase/recombinase XerD
MATATVSAFIDKYHPQKDGNCKVSIRITYSRKKKYYPTNLSLKASDFKRIMTAKRRSEADKAVYKKIHSFEEKALQAIEDLPVFTFGMFEDIYLQNREAADSIAFGFDKYITVLKDENRIGTAVSYECAKASLESFKQGLRFADITPALLRKYENWMLENNKSKTTVGIYLRSLRTIFNSASIDKALYPFGEKKGKYSIPTGSNIKKALTLSEIANIFHYEPQPGTGEAMAKDYWIFIYLCNGLNVKDLCLLKKKNIDGNVLTYERAKTKRSKKENDKISVSLKPEAKAIISKWGVPSINPESCIFPHLQKNMTAERERKVIQQLTKTINKYMKQIAKKLEINKEVTTYFARHSFATVLRNSGASMEFISEALGHSDMKTTKSYLAGFEQETIHKTTDALTAFSI